MNRRSSGASGAVRATVAAAIVIGLAVIVIAMSTYYLSARSTRLDIAPGQQVTIEIPEGASTKRIARILEDAGVVESATAFALKARAEEADGKLRAGSYELETGMSADEVLAELTAGPAIAYTEVTIPEGWRITQIAARLEKKAGIPSDEFLALADGGATEFESDHAYLKDAYKGSLEGFLFPKTYRIKEGATARDVIEMMLDQFDKEIESVDIEGAKKRGLSLPELVNVAAIVERETKLAKERPLVSAVIRNRLKQDMRLQMCSTVVYVLGKNELRLTTAETKTESPYNTYLHEGLPPGPIASPGLASLQAAAKPADKDYLFYVLTGKDGSHTFASSNAEFLKAKQKSKRVFGE